MTKKTIKIQFVDFWRNHKEEDNFFYKLLQKYMTIELSDKPDILFYSCFGSEHLKYTCKKIFYTGENVKPDYRYCDYSFSFENDSDQNMCLPLSFFHKDFLDFKNQKQTKVITRYQHAPKKNFCSFMATNTKAYERINFVQKLMKYKRVDCDGPVLYNMDKQKAETHRITRDWVEEKLEIIKNYKFTIAFENTRAKNYVTEKIYHPLLVKSIPIYWGAPNISEYFNPKCYIDISAFDSFESAINEIRRIDQNEHLYNSFFEESPILPNSKFVNITEEHIYSKIEDLLNSSQIPVGEKRLYVNKVYFYFKKIQKWLKF